MMNRLLRLPLGMLILFCCQRLAATEVVPLVVDANLAPPARLALEDLQRALKAKGMEPQRRESLDSEAPWNIVVGVAKASASFDRLLAERLIALPAPEESLCIEPLKIGDRNILLLAGRDARGLSYALLEAARAIELAPADGEPLRAVRAAVESPYLRVRSMTIHPCNEDVEKAWYFDERFWRDYFARLARCRYNNFTLTFSDQTNYLNPVYAYLVDVPEYPQVEVQGLTPEDRARNLAMLRRISELAGERGLDFTLGVWMQAPVPDYSAAVRVKSLPEGLAAASYAASGLRRVLEACPAITGVQFRMNAEAGVPEDQQTRFYRPLFEAIRGCGRPVRLDLRYKGLLPETTKSARDAGLGVTVSTKFWAEHLGLPYHPTVADRLYRDSRYSFGTMLAQPRDYRVTYRLWTAGSQRLLLWGDPEYAARFARNCRLGGGEGFEVFSPLTNKGHGNDPGAWRIFARPADEYYSWEHDRYWFFELVFGRMGYDPETSREVWHRELRHRFGEAAAIQMELAYVQGSRILALITATRLPSASEWRWWPEMDTGGRLAEYMHIQPADTAQFYAIHTWKRTPQWAWEAWDETIPGYVEDALAGRVRGKTTPWQIAGDLATHALLIEHHLENARLAVGKNESPEFRATCRDLSVLGSLGGYHSAKMSAATHLALFEATGDTGRLPLALRDARWAADDWRRIVKLTDGFYSDNLVFGIAPGSNRSRMGLHHGGHWKDRLPEVEQDVAHVEQLLKQHGGKDQLSREFPGESAPTKIWQVVHRPAAKVISGRKFSIQIRVKDAVPLSQVILHYRPLNQTVDWKQAPMEDAGDRRFRVTLAPAEISPQFDVQYYFELLKEGGGGWLWPLRQEADPYYVIPTGQPSP